MSSEYKSYLNLFKSLEEKFKSSFYLTGDCMLVEQIAPEEIKSKGGIIIADSVKSQLDTTLDNKPLFVRVLLTGPGFYEEETDEEIKLDCTPGDIVLIGKLSVKWLSTFGPLTAVGDSRIGLTRESEVQLRFKGQEGYDNVSNYIKEYLNV